MNLYAILGAGMLVLASVSGTYFVYSQHKIDTLTKSNAELVIANEQNVKTIKELKDSYDKLQQIYGNLVVSFDNIKIENSTLARKLAEHDLGALATQKPVLIQNRINAATNNVLLCFEALSGAYLTEEEKNALSKDSTACPGYSSR